MLELKDDCLQQILPGSIASDKNVQDVAKAISAKLQADIAKKRALVRNAIAWHRYKGTPAAVEEVCSAVFQSAKVFEWWEYGGVPYHFQVRLIEEGIPDKRIIDNLERAIQVTKNTRSWLDCLSFYRELLAIIYFAKV